MDTGRVPECIRYIPEYWRGYRNPPGKDMSLMGHRREANQPTRGWCAPTREEAELDLGRGRHPLSFSYSLSFPSPPPVEGKKGGAESY